MGTINYKTSNIITLGYDVPSVSDYENDEINEIKENGWSDINNYINSEVDEISSLCGEIIEKYNFNWFIAKLEWGYYEGFYLDLDTNYYSTDLLDNDERNEIKTEIDELQKMLVELLDYMWICYPGWCTGWNKNYSECISEIKTTMEKLKSEVV